MSNRKKISFVWQGVTERWHHWNDGLRLAMRYVGEVHDVSYKEPWDELTGDVILYWEAPCTINGSNAPHFIKVRDTPKPKALLFAGGPVTAENTEGFDLFFLESEINEGEFTKLRKNWIRAFGVNDEIFRPIPGIQKTFDGCMQATFAGWKRQPLFAEALGKNGILCGRYQEHEPYPFTASSQSVQLPEMPYEAVNVILNASHCAVNTSEFWGGGQRCTLEAMAAGIPAVVMSDSPKNREYVEESGAGIVCEPNPQSIREAVEAIKGWTKEEKERGIAYVQAKYSGRIYADNLLKGISCLVSQTK